MSVLDVVSNQITHITPLGTRAMQDLQEGRIAFTSEDFPAFMYAAGSYDPDDMEIGLLRHEFPLAVRPNIPDAARTHLCYRSDVIFSKRHPQPCVLLETVLHPNPAKRRCTISRP